MGDSTIKDSINISKFENQKKNSDALRIVREFQKNFRETIPREQPKKFGWESNRPSIAEGTLKHQNYAQDFQSIL